MSAFWFLAGMLTMFAVLVVILPWLRTVPRFESLPALPWQAPLIAMVLIGATLTMYSLIGRPELAAQAPAHAPAQMPLEPAPAMAGKTTPGGNSNAAGSMSAAIASLRSRLAGGKGSSDDWELLAKSYEFVGRADDARLARAHQLPPASADAAGPAMSSPGTPAPSAPAAGVVLSAESQALLSKASRARSEKQYAAAQKIYKQLAAAKQMNADAWADYADTAATLQGNKLVGEPETFIANALALAPDQPKALWLKASADEEAGRLNDAIAVWQHLQNVLPADSQDAKIVQANLQRDRESAGVTTAATPAAASGASIKGEVSIASNLSSKAAPGETLFIVAKSVDQPGPPVAVFRGSVNQWPVVFTLDDSSSMLPGRNLTNAKHVTVEARVSRSGQAQPAAGDLRGVTGVIDPASHQPLKIVINEIVT